MHLPLVQKQLVRKGKSKGRLFPVLFFLLLFAVTGVAAQEPVFIARASATKVAEHTVFEVRFELQNGRGTDFRPPSFRDFKVVGGPSTGSSTMIVNGVMSQSQSWSYSLLATKTGKFSIDPAVIVAGRKKLNTRPLQIEVMAAKDLATKGAASSSGEQVILKAELDADQYYPGQQIILTYRLLFRENVQTVSTIKEDDYGDFFIQHFSDFSREPTFETVNGLQFTSRIVKSLALFAHQSGTYTIEPMVMSVGINAPFPGNQGFFTMRRIQDVQVATEPMKITILPLPANAPTSFSGAVGQYAMTSKPGQTNITTDQAFSIQLEITGNGDARRWEVPTPIANGPFEIYEPKILEDKVFDAGNQVTHVRSVLYQMIPATPGDYEVYVPLTYFDPVQKQYVTINTDTISVHVTQGNGIAIDTLSEQPDTTALLELMPVRTVLVKDKFWVSAPHLALLAIALSGAMMGLMVSYKRKRDSQIPETEKVKRAASHKALSEYVRLEAGLSEMPASLFFSSATETFYMFLMERFMIPSADLDEANLRLYLSKASVPVDIVDRTVTFFNQCLTVRYGGIPGGYSREEMLKQCRELTDLLCLD